MLKENKITVKVINDDYEFELMKNEWNTLLRNSFSDNIFLTWEWVYLWWKSYKEGKELLLIKIIESDETIGIAPLYITKTLDYGIKPFRYVEFLGSVGTCSEYLDFIIKKEREQEVLTIIVEELFKFFKKRWDILNLVPIYEKSINLELFQKICLKKGIKYSAFSAIESPYMELPQTIDEYYKSLNSKKRSRLRKIRGNLFDKYTISFYETDDINRLEGDFNTFLTLHQKRWSEKSDEDSFSVSRRKFIGFHEQVIKLFLENKWLYLIFLKVNDKVVAAQYNFIYKNKVYYYSAGFDPEWSSYFVGIVLQMMALEDIIKKSIIEFDFLRGNEEYKYNWTKISRKSVKVVVWKSRLTYAMANVGKNLRKSVKAVLPKKITQKLYNNLFIRKDDKV